MNPNEISAALAPYGAALTDEGNIRKGDKVLGVRAKVVKGRLRFESASGLIASGKPCAAFVEEFVERFWYWKKEPSYV